MSAPETAPLISHVTLAQSGDRLHASATPAAAGLDHAFHLYRNGVRVGTTPYGPAAFHAFTIGAAPGYYSAIAFARTATGETARRHSTPVFAHAPNIAPDEFASAGGDLPACVVDTGWWQIPVVRYPGRPGALFVLLSGATDPKTAVPPVVHRTGWAAKGVFPGTVLCVADPTLRRYPTLTLGWYVGDRDHDPIVDLAAMLAGYCARRGIAHRDVVVWGSSGGGFAALALAAAIDGATAVAANAQTDILAYDGSHVDRLRRTCFGDQSRDGMHAQFADRIDMASRWRRPGGSRAVLVQNTLDVHHYDSHFAPFARSLGLPVPDRLSADTGATDGWSAAGPHRARIYADPRGHGAEPETMALEIVQRLAAEP